MTPTQALADYALCLQKLRDLDESYAVKHGELNQKMMKIEAYLLANTNEDVSELPAIVEDERPFVAWCLQPKTDLTATKAYMQMREVLKPRYENAVKEKVDALKAGMETIENWALRELNDRGGNNFNTDYATVSRTTVVNYKIADKSLFVKDAIDNGYSSELSVSVRPNSALMKQIVEERGDLPPGVSSSTFYEARFKKS